MEDWFQSIGHPKFRARQVFQWLYKPTKLSSELDEMSDVSVALRTQLSDIASVEALKLDHVHTADDGTQKLLFNLARGGQARRSHIP